nr:hypothetical protein [uncultured Nostoc sp.]
MISTISRRYSLDEYRAIEEKAEGRISLDSVAIALSMAEIYRGVIFE